LKEFTMPLHTPGQLLTANEDLNSAHGPTRASRVRGMVLMVLGPVLALIGAGALVAVGPMLLSGPPGREVGPSSQDLAAVMVLGWLVGFGLLGSISGWQLWKQGHFSRRLGYPLAVMVVGFLACVPWLRHLFD
jgi:hypothetical protein